MNIGIAFVLGCIIGSFLNVVILRLHTGRSLNGRSHCMSCGTQLRAYELIPILSYLMQRGRCRTCTAAIASRYVVVEAATGILFGLLAYTYPSDIVMLTLYGIVASVLVVITVYDIRHTVIPDEMVWILFLCAGGFAARTLFLDPTTGESLLYALAATILASGIFAFLWFISRGRWIGLGDAKLIAPLGFFLGPTGTFSFIILGFWIATAYVGVVTLMRTVLTKVIHKRFSLPRYTMRSEVPFGPFLIIGFFTVLIFHVDILTSIQSIADATTLALYAWFFTH